MATEAEATELEAKLWRVLSASEPVAETFRETGAGAGALGAALDDDVDAACGQAAGVTAYRVVRRERVKTLSERICKRETEKKHTGRVSCFWSSAFLRINASCSFTESYRKLIEATRT